MLTKSHPAAWASGSPDHETEVYYHPDSPSAMKTNIVLPANFEELLWRWTKLGRNEVQALGNTKSEIWSSISTI